MSRRELTETRAELAELKKLLRFLLPSGDAKRQDRLVHAVRRLAEYAEWLQFLSDPISSRPVGISGTVNVDQEEAAAGAGRGGRSAEQPIFPGVRLAPEHVKGDRNLYHAGREYGQELDRLITSLENLVDGSADWIRGLDRDPRPLPSQRRPRCECGEIMAITWKVCPYCERPRAGGTK